MNRIVPKTPPGDPPPARTTNPFATCWTSPGQLPFVVTETNEPTTVADRLVNLGWRGSIVGPHGSGKSALLAALDPVLQARGVHVERLIAGDALSLPPRPASKSTVLFVEGFERLGPFARRRLLLGCHGLGVVATLHRPGGCWPWRLPVVAEPKPTELLYDQLFAYLMRNEESEQQLVTREDALLALHQSHGNLRDAWFTLYDLYEQRRRDQPGPQGRWKNPPRTVPVWVA